MTYLNLCLHELREWNDIELGVSPEEAVVARCDRINLICIPVVVTFIVRLLEDAVISHLNVVIDEELEDAIGALLGPNRVLAILTSY